MREIVVAVGDQQLAVPPGGMRHQRPGLGRIDGHRLFAQHMGPGVQRVAGMGVMEPMRRGHHDNVRPPGQNVAMVL